MNLKTTLVFAALLPSAMQYASASESKIIIQMGKSNNESEDRHTATKGRRTPSYIICTIDFEGGKILHNIPESILSYELWDENGENMYASFETDQELLEIMPTLCGSFQLKFVTNEYLYIGYIEL